VVKGTRREVVDRTGRERPEMEEGHLESTTTEEVLVDGSCTLMSLWNMKLLAT
jgi:hypothetical protein